MRLSRIWRIKHIEEGVFWPRWITPSEICIILHILRKPHSLIANYESIKHELNMFLNKELF